MGGQTASLRLKLRQRRPFLESKAVIFGDNSIVILDLFTYIVDLLTADDWIAIFITARLALCYANDIYTE